MAIADRTFVPNVLYPCHDPLTPDRSCSVHYFLSIPRAVGSQSMFFDGSLVVCRCRSLRFGKENLLLKLASVTCDHNTMPNTPTTSIYSYLFGPCVSPIFVSKTCVPRLQWQALAQRSGRNISIIEAIFRIPTGGQHGYVRCVVRYCRSFVCHSIA